MKSCLKSPSAIALACCVAFSASTVAQAPAVPAKAKAAVAHKATAAPAGTLKIPVIKYETYTLPNGLKVITHEDHRLPLVAVDLWYHVGPLNERPGRTGFAHLFEHMMFEGSEHVGEKAHIKYVQGAGATDVNGTTDFDRTNYFETLPSNQLELGLWLESDRMGFLMEGLNRTLLANQRDVVRNERRQGEGRPYDLADEEMYHQLFPQGHPYYGDVIGSHADVEAARIADIRDFHQQYYTPNNASLAIDGDFNPVKLKAMLTKYFGPIPKGPPVPPVNVKTPAITEQKRVTVTDTVRLPQIIISWLTPPAYTPGAEDAQIAMFALGGGRASRLNQALVYKNQLAQSVRCGVRPMKLTGVAQCTVTAKPGVKVEELEETVWSELAKLQADGPTPQEVEASKALSLTREITGLQRLGGFGGIADALNEYNQYTGDPGYLPKDIAATQAVTVASAKAAAVKYFNKDSSVVITTVPGKKVLNDVPRSPDDTDADVQIVNPYTPAFEEAQNWRKTVPVAGPTPVFHLPVPQMFELANGMKVYYVHDTSLPILSASVAIRAGSENNPVDKGGVATLTAQVLGEATTTRDLTRLAEDQERIGIRIGVQAQMDSAAAGITVLTNHLNDGMDLLADVVQHPAFSEADVDRLRKQRLVSFAQEGDSVNALAGRVGPLLVFGDHPYGASPTGTTASVQKLTRDDLVAFYKSHYGPRDSALVLVGDVTEAEAHKIAEKSFGDWATTASSSVTIPPIPEMQKTHVVIVDKPGAPQSALTMLAIGVPEGSPDAPTLRVMNYTLGGSFASRINMNLREEHGYTYGANSGFRSYREGGTFVASSLVRTDVTGPAAKEMMHEIKNFPSSPPTDAELKMAKDASIQSIPGQFETGGATASAMHTIFIDNRPLDYFSTLPAKYEAITSADVARVANQYIHPDNMVILVVGDRAKIEPQLKDEKLGPIEIRDGQGTLVKGEQK
jgi:zinc protease